MDKVAIVCLNLSQTGGVEKVSEQLCNEFVCLYQVHLIGIICGERKTPLLLDERVKISYLFNEEKRTRDFFFTGAFRLKRYCEAKEIKYIIFQGEGAAILSILLKKISKIKCIYCDHGAINYQFSNIKDKEKTFNTIKLIAKSVDKVVTLTEDSREGYVNLLKINKDKIDNIYNFMNPKFFQQDYDENSKKIITVARLENGKGLEYLMMIAEKVLRNNIDWQWDLYGNGSMRDYIIAEIKRRQLNDQFNLIENINDLSNIYRKYSFYVMTSLHEGLPMVLLEAKASSLPIIAFNIKSGPSEIIINGVNGDLVENLNLNSMIEKVEKLMTNTKQRVFYSNHAYDNINNFTAESVVKKWKTLIDSL